MPGPRGGDAGCGSGAGGLPHSGRLRLRTHILGVLCSLSFLHLRPHCCPGGRGGQELGPGAGMCLGPGLWVPPASSQTSHLGTAPPRSRLCPAHTCTLGSPTSSSLTHRPVCLASFVDFQAPCCPPGSVERPARSGSWAAFCLLESRPSRLLTWELLVREPLYYRAFSFFRSTGDPAGCGL